MCGCMSIPRLAASPARLTIFRTAVGECRSFDEFHDECRRSIGLLETVNLVDVRMIERGQIHGLEMASVRLNRSRVGTLVR